MIYTLFFLYHLLNNISLFNKIYYLYTLFSLFFYCYNYNITPTIIIVYLYTIY